MLVVFCPVISKRIPTTIFVYVTNLSLTIFPSKIFPLVNIQVIKHLFSAASVRMAHIPLNLGKSHRYDISSGTQFNSTNSRIFTTNHLSSLFWESPTTNFIAFWRTLIRLFLPTESVVTRTPLFNVTVIDDMNPYTDILSFPPLPLLSFISEYNIMIIITSLFVRYLSATAFF